MMLSALYHLEAHPMGIEAQARFVACLHAIFLVFAGLGVLGVLASLVRGRMREGRRE